MTALRCSETLRKTAPAYERKFVLQKPKLAIAAIEIIVEKSYAA
ncbi:MAG: hypothetical protein ACJARU_001955 [Congregibacter sp.]|jgi:hypothetical protein